MKALYAKTLVNDTKTQKYTDTHTGSHPTSTSKNHPYPRAKTIKLTKLWQAVTKKASCCESFTQNYFTPSNCQ